MEEEKEKMNCGICDKEIEFNPAGLCLVCYCTRRGWTREFYEYWFWYHDYFRKRYEEDIPKTKAWLAKGKEGLLKRLIKRLIPSSRQAT